MENGAKEFKEVMENLIDTRISNKGITTFVSAIVSSINNDGSVDVYIPPDKEKIVHNLLNKTAEKLNVGDSVEICTKNGKLSNAWVSIKHGTNNSGGTDVEGDYLPLSGGTLTGTLTGTQINANESLNVKGNSVVDGSSTVGSSIVKGNSTINGNSTVQGNSTVKGDSTVEGVIKAYKGYLGQNNRPTTANIDSNQLGTMQLFKASNSMNEGKPMADGHIIHFNWDTIYNGTAQLYLPNSNTNKMQWRAMATPASSTWGEWRTLIDDTTIGSYLDADSGWKNLTFSSGYSNGSNTSQYRKIGKMVELRGTVKGFSNISYTQFATLPTGFRPSQNLAMLISRYHFAGTTATFQVLTNGAVRLSNANHTPNTSYEYIFQITFFVD